MKKKKEILDKEMKELIKVLAIPIGMFTGVKLARSLQG